jgi:hypothetical protein
MRRAPLVSSLVRGAQVKSKVLVTSILWRKKRRSWTALGGLFDSYSVQLFSDAAGTGFTIQSSTANLSVNEIAE